MRIVQSVECPVRAGNEVMLIIGWFEPRGRAEGIGCYQLDPTDVTVAARDGELAGVEQLHIPGWRRLRQQGRRLGLASMVDPPKRWAITQRSDADQQHIDRSAI